MGYKMVRKPFMLMETIAMIYKYVNGISFQSAISRQRFFMNNATYAERSRKLARLQQITEEVCAGLDVNDPRLQHYFCQAGDEPDSVCLAQVMTHPFCSLREPELRANVRDICEIWEDLKRRGYWLTSADQNLVFTFSREEDCPGDLFMQIKNLRFPGDFRMKMYECFRDFPAAMEELADLIEPLARSLEAVFRRESDLFRQTERYWDEFFQKTELKDFVATFAAPTFLQKMGEETRVAVLLMDSDLLTASSAGSHLNLGYNTLYIGCAIPSNGLPRSRGGDLETVGNMLKCLSDKKRLEILRRLSKEPSYGLELAEVMGMDSGHMSRILSQMNTFGFLREDKDRGRVYYKTDREAIRSFLELVENSIFID
ncbi:MAG: winged helix-turn-helix transcriptional regulator [Oscillospiraceae bacterium]|nr:winged helix-turn-helix transcriptional regulator [Oscillospiraceae bacterium]